METRWYSIHEKLPETFSFLAGCSSPVFVHYRRRWSDGSFGYDVQQGEYCGGSSWRALYCNERGEYSYKDVDADYWMPIPAIPRGGEK